MRIHATINERTLRRTFREHLNGNRALTVFDKHLRGFALKVSANGNKTFFVRAARTLGMAETVLGTAEELTAAQAREKAAAVIEAATTEREHGPLFGDFAHEFLRRHARRWKPATREANRHLTRRYLVPFFGHMRTADTAPSGCRVRSERPTGRHRGGGRLTGGQTDCCRGRGADERFGARPVP